MNLKNAALLAAVGMLLLTILLATDFVNIVSGVARDIVPMVTVLRSLVYLFVSLSLTIFFWMFYRGR